MAQQYFQYSGLDKPCEHGPIFCSHTSSSKFNFAFESRCVHKVADQSSNARLAFFYTPSITSRSVLLDTFVNISKPWCPLEVAVCPFFSWTGCTALLLWRPVSPRFLSSELRLLCRRIIDVSGRSDLLKTGSLFPLVLEHLRPSHGSFAHALLDWYVDGVELGRVPGGFVVEILAHAHAL